MHTVISTFFSGALWSSSNDADDFWNLHCSCMCCWRSWWLGIIKLVIAWNRIQSWQVQCADNDFRELSVLILRSFLFAAAAKKPPMLPSSGWWEQDRGCCAWSWKPWGTHMWSTAWWAWSLHPEEREYTLELQKIQKRPSKKLGNWTLERLDVSIWEWGGWEGSMTVTELGKQ